MAEWLRRLTRNQIPSGSVGSSPTDRAIVIAAVHVFSLSCDVSKSRSISAFRSSVARRPRGVTVSTQDSESCDPSSNLGGTLIMHSKVVKVMQTVGNGPAIRDSLLGFYSITIELKTRRATIARLEAMQSILRNALQGTRRP